MTTLTAATPTTGGALLSGTAPRSGAPAGAGLSSSDIVQILRQRLVLICVVWFFMVVLSVGFTFYMRHYYPEYRANALIRVDSISPQSVTEPLKRETTRQEDIDRELQNQVLLVKSPAVLQKAVEDPDLRRTVWYQEAEEDAKEKGESVLDILDDTIGASPFRNSNFLNVAAAWRIPKELPILVNTVVQKYVAEIDRQQKNAIRSSEDQLGKELELAKKYYEGIKQELEAFRQTADFSSITSQEASETVLTLTSLVTELEVDMLGRKTQWETLQNVKPEEMPITAELQAMLAQDPAIHRLEQDLLSAEQSLNLVLRRFGPNHRTAKQARYNRDSLALQAEQERAIKILDYQKQQLDYAQRSYLEAQEQLLTLKEKLIDAKAEQNDKDIKKARYESMLDDRDQARFRYESLLQNKNDVSMVLRQKSTVQIAIQSNAIEPQRLSSPDLRIWIPAGCLFGLAVSVGLAFLLEMTDKSVRTSRDVMRTHLPVLGTIPTTDDDEVEIERVETASLDAPHSIVAESFRNLRANLFFSAPAEQQGVILVTSPSGGNGKTAVSSNLAISIALSGRRVLLVDANFRRAGLPRIFPKMKSEGLSNILIGQGTLEDYVTETSVPGLDVLSAGPIPPNPAELLGSSYLRDIIVDARSRYDQVIFDGPPVLLVSDAMVLAGSVDGCLLVCQYRATSRGALQRTQTSLGAINARIFGAVLNMVQTRAGGYFRKAYREFYEYHEVDEEAADSLPQLDAVESSTSSAPRPGSQPPGGMGESRLEDETALLDADDLRDPLPEDEVAASADRGDLDDVKDLDIFEDHDFGMREGPLTSTELETPDWLEPSSEEADEGLGDLETDLGGEAPLGDDLADLEGDDFKIDEIFDADDGLESPNNPDRPADDDDMDDRVN
jgi:capsular exopolysaccharide synthesis family protein